MFAVWIVDTAAGRDPNVFFLKQLQRDSLIVEILDQPGVHARKRLHGALWPLQLHESAGRHAIENSLARLV